MPAVRITESARQWGKMTTSMMSKAPSWRVEAFRLIGPGAAILALAALVIGRIPLGGPGALASGLAAYWLGGRRLILTIPGYLFGVCIGASVHAHLVQTRFGSVGELLSEVGRDAVPGAIVGLAALVPVFVALHLRARRSRASSQEGSHEQGRLVSRRAGNERIVR